MNHLTTSLLCLRLWLYYALLLALAWLLPKVVLAEHTETFVVLCEAEERLLQLGDALTQDIKEEAEAGDYYHVVCVPSHETVVSIEVPAGTKQSRLKRRSLVKELQALKTWFVRGPPGESRQLRLYGLAETIANLRKYPDSRCRVVCVGSPVFVDAHYAGLNMVGKNGEALVPLDGWFEPGANSPFGPNLYSLPPRTVATWITQSSLWGPTNSIRHRQEIKRFYRLWFESQNDSLLARFSSSPSEAFDFTPDTNHVPIHRRAEPAAMRQVIDGSDQAPPHHPPGRRAVRIIPEQQLAVESKQSYLPGDCWLEFLAKHRETISDISIIRLRYVQDESPDTATDVDLHLVDSTTGKEIWFKNPKVSGLGRLYNDVRVGSAKSSDGEPIFETNFEFICIEPDRDLEGSTLWVNKYLGVGEVAFEVSLFVRGAEIAAKKFSFGTPKGDLGVDADNRGGSENWMRIDLQELLRGQQLTSR